MLLPQQCNAEHKDSNVCVQSFSFSVVLSTHAEETLSTYDMAAASIQKSNVCKP